MTKGSTDKCTVKEEKHFSVKEKFLFIEVPGGEPDAITRMEHGSLTEVVIRLLFLMAGCALKSHVAIVPYLFCTSELLKANAAAAYWLSVNNTYKETQHTQATVVEVLAA